MENVRLYLLLVLLNILCTNARNVNVNTRNGDANIAGFDESLIHQIRDTFINANVRNNDEEPIADTGDLKRDYLETRNVDTTEMPAKRPGVIGRITQKGFDFAAALSSRILMLELAKIQIPSVTHTVAKSVVTVSEIKLTLPNPPQSRLFPIPYPGYGFRWHSYNINPSVTAKYTAVIDFFFFEVKKEGTVEFEGEDMFFALDFFVASDEDGRPAPEVTSCVSDGDIDLSFRGEWSDILNMGAGMFKRDIRQLITAQICFQAKKEINAKLSEQLQSLPLYQQIANDYLVDLRMIGNPHFDKDAVDIPIKGTVYMINDEEELYEPPFFPPEITDHHTDNDRMAYLYVTDYFINSALYAMFKNGLLAYNVTPEMVPAEFRHYLNTSCEGDVCLGTIFPQLAVLHPSVAVSVGILATNEPSIKIDGKTLTLSVTGEADVYITQPDGSQVSVFVVNVDIVGGVKLDFIDDKLYFNVTHIDPRADVKESFIGDIGSGFFFESILRVIAQKALIPKLTEFGAKGFSMPAIKGVRPQRPIIVDSGIENVFVLATDIAYEMPRKRILARRQYWAKRRAERAEKRTRRAMMMAMQG